MKKFVCAAFLTLLFLDLSMAKILSPDVQVYSRYPGFFSEPNTVICHASNFYPPDIKIEILRNKEVIPGGHQSDLAFEDTWHYFLTKSMPFTPKEGVDFACRVTHAGTTKTYAWEPDM